MRPQPSSHGAVFITIEIAPALLKKSKEMKYVTEWELKIE